LPWRPKEQQLAGSKSGSTRAPGRWLGHLTSCAQRGGSPTTTLATTGVRLEAPDPRKRGSVHQTASARLPSSRPLSPSLARRMVFEIVSWEEELGRLHVFVDEAERGPAALVLEGDAGNGKSTLWLAGVERARAGIARSLVATGRGRARPRLRRAGRPVRGRPRRRPACAISAEAARAPKTRARSLVRRGARAQWRTAWPTSSLTEPDRGHSAGARRRRKPRVSQIAGSATRALPGRQQPIPAKVDQRNELPAIRSNPYSYRNPAASDGQQPILTRSPVGPFLPEIG
jgi:hypothetical protein